MEAKNENKIKQEENLDADEEKLKQLITIIKNDIRFEDLRTFFQKYSLEIPIQTFIRNFESTCDSFDIPEKQKILFITKLVDGAVKTYIKSQSIPKSFYELKNNLIREFGKRVNPAEIHLQLSKTEKTSKETHIEYFYRIKEIASRINMEKEAEKFYIIKGLKENRSIELQLQSCSNIEELKEKMKLLDIQEKSKSNVNEIIYPKYPVTRIPHHTNQFVRRKQYGGWNWRNDQSQHPDAITGSRYNVYSPQFLLPSYHHPSFSLQRPTLYPRNQRFPQRPTDLRPNAPTFNPRQRTQNNNTVFRPHQTGELMIIQGRINFKQVDVLLDTGSRERESVNIIPKNIISQIKGYHNVEYIKRKIATINGEIEVTLHLELVSDLTSEAFIASLKRFCARREAPKHIYCDNGTTFVGARRKLQEIFKFASKLNENEHFCYFLSQVNIVAFFSPPVSPHFGGLWEAGVKSIKYYLKRVIGNTNLTFEEFSTLLTQVEAILNSRPLVSLDCDNDPDSLNILTPHFFIGEVITFFPEHTNDDKFSLRSHWDIVQKMKLGFWRKWKIDYLSNLQNRTKWKSPNHNIKVGEIVIIKEDNIPPPTWPLGKVIETQPGKDGVDEVEKLAYQLNEEAEWTERPIRRLSKVMYGSTCTDMQVDVMGECLSSIKHVVGVRAVFLEKRLHAV
ncbi:integrase catalytic domain-containing protein [Trichonephila clavipes]|nr:integrase catalytic domain-containing protein [Trichonephila clavipes]